MNKNIKNFILLIVGIIVGLVIAFSPVIITGTWYNVERTIGNLLIAEFVLRTSSIIVGLLVVYDTVKTFSRD
ncbi:hypothetical protein [Paraliobacillus ryukyuensis]|uniref:hypothetical protein n=1 Tax=Paraliobacillus ryukyuensis TaxID=200904 RepID=UPI0009A5C309|nr:hypothetical protein [Paraliobacillus ryukyuensis]